MTEVNGGPEHVPEGWRQVELRELCSFQVGPAIGRDERTDADSGDSGVLLVLPRDIAHQRITPAESVGVVPEKARALSKYRLAAGDVLVVRTGTVGRCALVTGEHENWLYHANLVRLRPDEPTPALTASLAAYLTGYLSAGVAQNWMRQRSAGSVIPSLSSRDLGELPVLLPPPAERRAIGETLSALDDKVRVHTEIVRATEEYRALLADLLMTGALSAGA